MVRHAELGADWGNALQVGGGTIEGAIGIVWVAEVDEVRGTWRLGGDIDVDVVTIGEAT